MTSSDSRISDPDDSRQGDVESGLREVELELLARAPETVVDPSLDRIARLVSVMGDPQRAVPVIHIAGTNGKTSTARIIESILRAFGLRTGLYTSPHLRSLRERIQLDGKPIAKADFVAAYAEVAPYLGLAEYSTNHLSHQPESSGWKPATGLAGTANDARRDPSRESNRRATHLSMFEVLTAMAFSAFADAPVDVMIFECGLGGRWDATNVVEPAVSVITAVDVDHTEYLGERIESIAAEKAGILRSGVPAVFAPQSHAVASVLIQCCQELGIQPARDGIEFGIAERLLAVGGQQLSIDGLAGRYDDLFLPLHGYHQAVNAAVAIAAVETFLGGGSRKLNEESVRAGLAQVKSPGRLELLRSGPTVVVDSAHNPHGALALRNALSETFDFGYVIGIVAAMADKDLIGILKAVEPVIDELIVTENSSPRSALASELAETARAVFGDDERVTISPSLPEAVDDALERADESMRHGSIGIVAFGSVVTAADVRAYLGAETR